MFRYLIKHRQISRCNKITAFVDYDTVQFLYLHPHGANTSPCPLKIRVEAVLYAHDDRDKANLTGTMHMYVYKSNRNLLRLLGLSNHLRFIYGLIKTIVC